MGTAVKVELHSHTRDDPDDAIGHSALELVDRALALGFGALAILEPCYVTCNRGRQAHAHHRSLDLS